MNNIEFLEMKCLELKNKEIPCLLYKNNENFALLMYPWVSLKEGKIMMLYICLEDGELNLIKEQASWWALKNIAQYYLLNDEAAGERLVDFFGMCFHDEVIPCTMHNLDELTTEMIELYQRHTGCKLDRIESSLFFELLMYYAVDVLHQYYYLGGD